MVELKCKNFFTIIKEQLVEHYMQIRSVGGIHVGEDCSWSEIFPDQSLCAIPVEVRGGVPNTGEVDTGCWVERVQRYLNVDEPSVLHMHRGNGKCTLKSKHNTEEQC